MRFKSPLLAIVCTVAGCATHALTSFRTESSTAGQYYAVPMFRWSATGTTDEARVAAILNEPLYGPFTANRSERLIEGSSYFFIPVCNGEIRLAKRRQDVVRRGGSTSVAC